MTTFTKKDLDNIMRDVRREHMENIRVVSIERDKLKKELKNCEKNMMKNASSSDFKREYNLLSKRYEKCREEVNLLKMMSEDIRQRPLSIMPLDNRVMDALVLSSPKGKRQPLPSFLTDISKFNKGANLKDISAVKIDRQINPSFLQGIASFNKGTLKKSPKSSRQIVPNFLQGISSFNKSALKKSPKREPTKSYLEKEKQAQKLKPKTLSEQITSKFANVRRPPSDDESGSDSDDWGFSAKRMSRRKSKSRKSKSRKSKVRKSKAKKSKARK